MILMHMHMHQLHQLNRLRSAHLQICANFESINQSILKVSPDYTRVCFGLPCSVALAVAVAGIAVATAAVPQYVPPAIQLKVWHLTSCPVQASAAWQFAEQFIRALSNRLADLSKPLLDASATANCA